MKRRYLFLVSILVCVSIIPFWIAKILAQEDTSTTFPVNEAGIAAYTYCEGITPEKISKIPFKTIEKQEKTYIIGKVAIGGGMTVSGNSYYTFPNVYIGLDGWVVAYYQREEEASRILNHVFIDEQHRGGGNKAKIGKNSLEEAIEFVSQQGNFICDNELKYYHFKYPNANKMTLVGECAGWKCISSNSFIVSFNGTLYEASYSAIGDGAVFSIKIGDSEVASVPNDFRNPTYGKFSLENFTPGQGTRIEFSVKKQEGGYGSGILGVVFIYGE
jgi:predicted GNAT family acetyltransferase